MNARQFLVEVLKGLEASVPPDPGCHYAVLFAKYGSDEDGWEDRLAVHMKHAGKMHTLFLEEADFQKEPSALISDIVAAILV